MFLPRKVHFEEYFGALPAILIIIIINNNHGVVGDLNNFSVIIDYYSVKRA